MELFSYEVVDKKGNILLGTINAQHSAEASQKLKQDGYMIIEVKPDKGSKKLFSLTSKGKKITLGDKTLFSRQLAAMLNAGIPITRALFTLSEQTNNPSFRKALDDIAKKVESGTSISEAFAGYPLIFNDMYLGMIKAGEMGGTLGETLVRLSDQMQKEKILKDNIRSATVYPVSVVSFAILILIAMLVFLVPIFQGFFPEDADVPGATKVVIALSVSIRSYWYIWLMAGAAILGALYYYSKSPAGILIIDKIRFKVPGFGPLFHRIAIARFSRTFSTLFSNGIPVMQSLRSAGQSTGSRIIESAIDESVVEIQEGKNIGETFAKHDIFPPIVTHMIAVGEETGSLPTLLTKVAEFYEDEVETMSKTITSMIEPILLIFVGIVVGGMLVSLYLPIFTVITQTV
ncbi:MAG TPA: type II secretion system F family protein [Clostridia bacterium]|nr:type II secretion system F family protein [Clostridia bacterium]